MIVLNTLNAYPTHNFTPSRVKRLCIIVYENHRITHNNASSSLRGWSTTELHNDQ